jgi:hypothetical protein
MGNHHDRQTLAVLLLEYPGDFIRVFMVEIPGRFIGKQDFRLFDQGARHGDSLLFSSGEVSRAMIQAVAHPEAGENIDRSRAPLTFAGVIEAKSQFNIALSSQVRHQIESLENHSDSVRSVAREFPSGHLSEAVPVNENIAGSWPVQPGHYV